MALQERNLYPEGVDRRLSVDRIIQVLEEAFPEIVCEVTRGTVNEAEGTTEVTIVTTFKARRRKVDHGTARA